MKRALIIILFFCNHSILFCQSVVFNNLYNLPSDTVLATSGIYTGQYLYNDDIISAVVEMNDSSFITSGYGNNHWSYSNSPVHYYFRALKIDRYGNLMEDTIIDPIYGGDEIGHSMVKDADNVYIIGYQRDSLNSVFTNNFLLKLKKDFSDYDIIDVNYADSMNQINAIAIVDSSIYISNQYKLNSNTLPDFNLTKLNIDGVVLDTLVFNSPYKNLSTIISPFQDSILFIIERIEESYYNSYSILHKVNLNTNSVIESSLPINFVPNNLNLIRDLKITENNEFYVCGWYNDVLGASRDRTALMKLDIDGNIIWKKFYDLDQNSNNDAFLGSLEETDNGDLVLFGLYLNSNSYYKGKLMRIEKNTGDIIWERLLQRDTFQYVNNGYDDILYNMQKTSDKGYLLNGRANNVELIGDTSPIKRVADAWLLKTDSCGFTEGDFPLPNFVVENIDKFTITLKNTSDNYCTASINYGNGDSTKFCAYSTPRPEQFTYTFADTGTYTIKLTALAGEEFRTYENTVRIYGDTTVGIEEIMLDQFEVNLYPNPAQDQVNIVFNETLVQKNTTIKTKVFNFSGKEVLNLDFNTNIQKQKVDVSKLSNGVYYMSFYNIENLNLGSKKFVVLR